ncbi:HAMP domain-containing histidine kinase [Neobacillus sp. MER 74]|uniref:HAMP domain-containing sensor histidine kinase n=1 Tax=Neobacillus sp. MER 74 TaxID=2939566 RepID=UPI0020401B1D|nr:HAMP domain-containing sensor histidine kinase [Neobacillus sp. MER 74]MCM3117492.1 HAMP domain-containing histidine kinase [Neobacillus sp. MER 74]
MDIKLKKFSHLLTTKIIVLMIAVVCLTGIIKAVIQVEVVHDGYFGMVMEEDYLSSNAYIRENEKIVDNLTTLLREYKSEDHILKGGSIGEERLRMETMELYSDFELSSKDYRPELREAENYSAFTKEYADKIAQVKERLIKEDLRTYHRLLQELTEQRNPLFYASDGVNVYTNTTMKEKSQFKEYPAYLVFGDYKKEVYPSEIEENEQFRFITDPIEELNQDKTVVYIAFTDDFLSQKINEWNQDKALVTKNLSILAAFLLGFLLSFGYLLLVTGRRSFKDDHVHLHTVNRLYNDINIALCISLITIWGTSMDNVAQQNIDKIAIPITIPISAVVFVLILSLAKHIKNKTFFKHTLIFAIIHKLITIVRNVYESGNVAVKTVLIVIGYPLLVAVTFFMFPVTIGLAAWFAYKKVKSFQVIQDGVERIKAGNLQHRIDVVDRGEFKTLANNINSITDGLTMAVDRELKSERLKTELITNVSHDIRTPLTSIITYVDLLKGEEATPRAAEYIEILDQKSKRLKLLTDDLFEAAKATSGNISVDFEKIDIVSLITQGLGEVNDRIEASHLQFKLNHPKDKMYIKADGKLLWRSIENLLSNIFKYALSGSRVYIDIEADDREIQLSFKNISAYELNISADELMERFKRGDESRSSQGSGLGLSIAKSLIEAQKGKFNIHVDGDLFKAVITFPMVPDTHTKDVTDHPF